MGPFFFFFWGGGGGEGWFLFCFVFVVEIFQLFYKLECCISLIILIVFSVVYLLHLYFYQGRRTEIHMSGKESHAMPQKFSLFSCYF